MSTTDKISAVLESESIPKLLWKFALPAVIGTMVNALYNVVDRIFIGQGVGSLAISGLAVTFPILIFLQAMGMLIGAGAATRISILLGQKRRDEAEKLLGNAFLLTLLVSGSATFLCVLFLEPLLLAFGASEQTLPYAYDYLMIVLPGNICANIAFSYNAVMRASGYPTRAMFTMLVGAVSNIILDAVFIFGLDMGIKGAAWATAYSMFLCMCFVLSHYRRKDSNLQLLVSNMRMRKDYTIAILSIGMAPFVMQLTSSAIAVIINTGLLRYGGDLAVGAYGILNSFVMIIFMFFLGISQGMQPIVGYNYGAHLYKRVKEATWIAMYLNMGIGLIGGAMALFFPEFIVAAFTKDPELASITVSAIRICTFHFALVGFQVTITQYFQSTGYARSSIFLSLTRQVLYLIPLLFLLPTLWGLKGIWWSLPISDILSSFTAFAMYWIHYKKELLPHFS